MARIAVPFVVAVFVFSLTLSHARVPEDIPGNEVTNGDLTGSHPESDVNSVIRLPSDPRSHSDEPVKEAQESEILSTVQPVPLNVVPFRPVDHPFRLRSRFPFRCRHHHHHHRFFIPMRQHREIPYGDDMILTSGGNGDFDQGMFHRGVRRIPARWVKVIRHRRHHHDDEDEDGDGISKLMVRHSTDAFDKDKFKMHKHHHHHHEADEEEKEEQFKEHKERKEKAGGFIWGIRKILDHF